MKTQLTTLALISGIALGTSVMAQDAAETAETAETVAEQPAAPQTETAPEDAPATAAEPALPLGEPDPADAVGTTYLEGKHGDWELRCVKAPEGQKDPCQLYQLLKDEAGNPVAEISLFPLPAESEGAKAGATVVTPLETLLTEQLRVSVDGSQAKRYPFTWCSQVGCFARLGFTDADINAFKRGNAAALTIVPVAAPDQTVKLNVSLSGFTAGYDAIAAKLAE